MSDRFKFRAWDGKTMWMGWSLHGCNDGSFYGGHFGDVDPPSEEGCPRDGWEWKSADEITLMQCTGLRDANGVLIFEGDIVAAKFQPHYVDRVSWQGPPDVIATVFWDYNGELYT